MSDRREQYEQGIVSTTDGKPPEKFDTGAPGPIRHNGQHSQYWVLSEAERAKGSIRPVRQSYKHVGLPTPVHPLRDLTDEERERYAGVGYVKYEEYPKGDTSVVGRFYTQAHLDQIGAGCGTVTTMGRALAETYARDPHFYGSTMCVGCGTHLPIGEAGEFVWDGTDERVGT